MAGVTYLVRENQGQFDAEAGGYIGGGYELMPTINSAGGTSQPFNSIPITGIDPSLVGQSLTADQVQRMIPQARLGEGPLVSRPWSMPVVNGVSGTGYFDPFTGQLQRANYTDDDRSDVLGNAIGRYFPGIVAGIMTGGIASAAGLGSTAGQVFSRAASGAVNAGMNSGGNMTNTPSDTQSSQANPFLSGLIGAGLNALGGNNQSFGSTADPFASQRGQYQTQLSNLMNGQFGPSDPSYQWRFDQGQQALERSAAAQGFLNSGNLATALVGYGQGMASTEYGNQFNRLASLAGVNAGSPAYAAQLGQQQQLANQQSNAATANLLGGLINSSGGLSGIFSGIGGLFGSGGSSFLDSTAPQAASEGVFAGAGNYFDGGDIFSLA